MNDSLRTSAHFACWLAVAGALLLTGCGGSVRGNTNANGLSFSINQEKSSLGSLTPDFHFQIHNPTQQVQLIGGAVYGRDGSIVLPRTAITFEAKQNGHTTRASPMSGAMAPAGGSSGTCWLHAGDSLDVNYSISLTQLDLEPGLFEIRALIADGNLKSNWLKMKLPTPWAKRDRKIWPDIAIAPNFKVYTDRRAFEIARADWPAVAGQLQVRGDEAAVINLASTEPMSKKIRGFNLTTKKWYEFKLPSQVESRWLVERKSDIEYVLHGVYRIPAEHEASAPAK